MPQSLLTNVTTVTVIMFIWFFLCHGLLNHGLLNKQKLTISYITISLRLGFITNVWLYRYDKPQTLLITHYTDAWPNYQNKSIGIWNKPWYQNDRPLWCHQANITIMWFVSIMLWQLTQVCKLHWVQLMQLVRYQDLYVVIPPFRAAQVKTIKWCGTLTYSVANSWKKDKS